MAGNPEAAAIAAETRWSRLGTEERRQATEPARRALEARLARDAGLTGDEPPEEYGKRLANAKRAYALRMHAARRRKRASS